MRRHFDKKGYLVFKDPYGRYVKVKRVNERYIPKNWLPVSDKKTHDEDGLLKEAAHGLVEITSHKHAKWFTSPHNINIGLIFGEIDGKRKKNLF